MRFWLYDVLDRFLTRHPGFSMFTWSDEAIGLFACLAIACFFVIVGWALARVEVTPSERQS